MATFPSDSSAYVYEHRYFHTCFYSDPIIEIRGARGANRGKNGIFL